MATVIKTLENTGIDTIHSTFVRAFADYQVDISYMTRDVIFKRFEKMDTGLNFQRVYLIMAIYRALPL